MTIRIEKCCLGGHTKLDFEEKQQVFRAMYKLQVVQFNFGIFFKLNLNELNFVL